MHRGWHFDVALEGGTRSLPLPHDNLGAGAAALGWTVGTEGTRAAHAGCPAAHISGGAWQGAWTGPGESGKAFWRK